MSDETSAWPFPWPEPTGENSHYQTNGPPDGAVFTLNGHEFSVQPTSDDGLHTCRTRFSVKCNTCAVELHRGTTSPPSMIHAHLRGSLKGTPVEAATAAAPVTYTTTDYNGLAIGSGTKITERTPISIRVVPYTDRPDYKHVRITQTVKLSCDALIPIGGKPYTICNLCGVPAPLPDAKGAAYILAHHDGFRICFPREEAVRGERDQYPVTGWVKLPNGDLACAKCNDDWKAFVAAKKRESHK